VLCGADGPTAIFKWAEAKRELLLKALPLPNGIPLSVCGLKPATFSRVEIGQWC